MSFIFCQTSKFNQPLNNWDVSNVKDMEAMFLGVEDFNFPLNNWDVSIYKFLYNFYVIV